MSRLPKFLWVLFAATFILVLATHFGFDGQPNGWSSRGEFALVFGVAFAFSQVLIVFLYSRIHTMPGAINWPNKDYWLSTNETRARFFPRVRNALAATGAFAAFVFLCVLSLIIQEARSETGFKFPFNLAMGLIVLAGVGFVVALAAYAREK